MTQQRGVSRRSALGVPGTLIVAAIVVLAAAGPARAEIPGDVPDKVRLSFGGIAAETYTDAGLASTSAGVGASVNFEDIFNLPVSKDTWRVELNWHMNKRQFMDFGYFELNRAGSRIIQQDVNWGNVTFNAGADVTAKFESNFPYVAWRYSFINLPQVRISGSAGFNYLTLKAGLEASGTVTNPPASGTVNEDVKVSAPVPQIGLQVDWSVSKHLAAILYLRQIYVNNIAGINGGIGESALRLSWWYSKHGGVTAGLDKESIDLKSYETGDAKAKFRYEVRGFSLYFNLAF